MRLPLALSVFVALPFFACGKASAPPADTKCQADSDCVFACQARGDCCPNPYCENVMHRLVADDARQFNEKNCKPDDRKDCPQIGSRMAPDYSVVPRCRANACVAEKIPHKKDASSPPQ